MKLVVSVLWYVQKANMVCEEAIFAVLRGLFFIGKYNLFYETVKIFARITKVRYTIYFC